MADLDGLKGLEERGARFLGRCMVNERLPRVCIPAPPPPAAAVFVFTLRTNMHCWQEQGWPSPVAGSPPLG